MTKAKAIEILNELFDSYLVMEKMCLDTIIKVDGKQVTLRDKLDEITDVEIAVLTAIDALEQDNGWISVKDRMPELFKNVLTIDNEGKIFINWLEEIREWKSYFAYGGESVTHWRPLPEPPEGAEIMEAIAGSETSDRAERRPR